MPTPIHPDAYDILRRIDDPKTNYVQIWLEKQATVKELIKALRASSNARQRAILCYVMGKRHAKSAYPLILECLNDPSSDVRNDAAEALDRLGNPAAGSALHKSFLVEEDPGAKSSMAMALGRVKYQAATSALIEALNDADQRVWHMAAWSLGYMGTQETIQQLQDALENEPDAQTQTVIRKIIDEISSRIYSV